jgi:hypothetical protein
MVVVQSRFLQLVLSPLTGDRVTVGLVHWDGIELRAVSSLDLLPSAVGSEKPALKAAVSALMRRAEASSKPNRKRQRSCLSLDDIFPVRTGMGARLSWTGVRESETDDSESHFRRLSSQAGLDGSTPRSELAVAKALRKDLVGIGRSLEPIAQGRVRVDHIVSRMHEFTSPLSWKNGAWHHTMLANFARSTERGMTEEANSIFGRVSLSVPGDDKVVVLALLPDEADLQSVACREASLLRSPAVEVFEAKSSDKRSLVVKLEDRVRSEVLADLPDVPDNRK